MRSFILFFIFSLGFAQSRTDKGIVYYNEIQCLQMGAKNGPERLSTLIFNKSESLYVTRKDSLDKLAQTQIKDIYQGTGELKQITLGNLPTTKEGFEVYTSLVKDSVYTSLEWYHFVYAREKQYKINWQFSSETKKIGNYDCNKATCTFRGREYTAWYATEIPVPFGPWKLQGLPGLILEAYDINQEIYFSIKKMEYPTNNPTVIKNIKKDKNTKWLTHQEYIKWCDNNLQETYERGILLGVKMVKNTMIEIYKEVSE